jgi:hypothetical protein
LNVSLRHWVAFRNSQGINTEDAVQEWNGWQVCADV